MKAAPHRLLDVRRDELGIVIASCLFFFCLLGANYVWRPVRDEMGVSAGPENLWGLYTGTLVATLVVSPIFAWLVSRMQRRLFITLTYRFFALSLVIFFAIIHGEDIEGSRASMVLYVWLSTFNLLIISVFWGFMGDIFRNEQSKRLYGLIGAGGTLGAVVASKSISWLMALETHPDPATLLLLAALLLEICVQTMQWIAKRAPPRPAQPHLVEPQRPDALTGMRLIRQKPYLQILCVYMTLQTICATFLYYEQANLLKQLMPDRADRTVFLADINFWVNTLTLCVQVFFTGKLLRWMGITFTLLPLPLIAMGGFSALASHASLFALQTMTILSKACEYATAKPARETLYTVVSRAEKYQAKSFIDTFVYRGGDWLGGFFFHQIFSRGILSLSGMAWLAVPIAGAWTAVAYTLGRRQEALAKAAEISSDAHAQASFAGSGRLESENKGA